MKGNWTVTGPEDYAPARNGFAAPEAHSANTQPDFTQARAWAPSDDNGTAAQQDAQAFPVQVSLELLGLKISLEMHISITNLAANNSNGTRLWYVRRSLAVLFNTIANALFPDAERTASTEI